MRAPYWEYWPEVVAVRPLFPSTARASSVSKLFIWHSALIVKSTSGGLWLAPKGLPPWRILDDARNSDKSKLPLVRKQFIDVKSPYISLHKTSKKLFNGIWQKQLLILKFHKGFFVISVAFFLSVFALFCWLIKSSMASWLSVMPVSVSE